MTKEYIKYHQRKDAHQCVKCGQPIGSDGIMCESCREKHNAHRSERKEMRRMLGLCTCCGSRAAEPGGMMCIECRDAQNDYYKKSGASERRKETLKRYDANKYEYRKQNGLCTACGKSKSQHGLLCNACYVRRKQNSQKRRSARGMVDRQSWAYMNKCYLCGGIAIDGFKVCQKCYDSLAKKRILAINALKSDEHRIKMHEIYGGFYEEQK